MGGRMKYATEEERLEAVRASRRKYNVSAKGRAAMKGWYAENKDDPEFKQKRNVNQQRLRAGYSEEEKTLQRDKDAARARADRRYDPVKYLLYDAKKRAIRKGLPFELVRGDITIPEVCPVLGIPLLVAVGGKRTANSPSLDRWDNTKGYTKENTRVISLRANTLKNDATLEEMRAIVKYMEV